MKIFVGKATSSVKIMNFSIGEIDMSMSFKLQKFLYLLTTIKLYTSMKRQPIFNKLILQDVFNCHYMQPMQIRIELFLRSTCRHLFYYGELSRVSFAGRGYFSCVADFVRVSPVFFVGRGFFAGHEFFCPERNFKTFTMSLCPTMIPGDPKHGKVYTGTSCQI